jgi:rSAM/selenodomain-associated transferase 1
VSRLCAECRVVVLAKAPQPGRVKTRLVPVLGEQGAAELYVQLLWRTLQVASGVGEWPVELWCSPCQDHPFFATCRSDFGVMLRDQQGSDLGERMMTAGLADACPVVLIGADCPMLDADYLRGAISALAAGDEVVIGPAEDGGYGLIGMRRLVPELFRDMPWGSDQVLARTRDRLASLGVVWRELNVLWDVDRPEDLRRLESCNGIDPVRMPVGVERRTLAERRARRPRYAARTGAKSR